MPEQSFSNYSILQKCCKKQETQLDTMVHSLQNTYQWLLSWVGEPGEVTHDPLVVSTTDFMGPGHSKQYVLGQLQCVETIVQSFSFLALALQAWENFKDSGGISSVNQL